MWSMLINKEGTMNAFVFVVLSNSKQTLLIQESVSTVSNC